MSLFLTGTDTGVGKTFVATRLLHWLREQNIRAVGMKPICCGDRTDAHELLAASAGGVTLDELNPVWLKSPVAPAVAAQIEGVVIDVEKICGCFQALASRFEFVVVEGVGGWLVPIRRNFHVSDLARRLGLPVAIVAENRLGCLNHALLTVEAVQRTGVLLAGVILNKAEAAEDLAQSTNEAALREVLLGTPLVRFSSAAAEQTESFKKLRRVLFKSNTQL